MTVSRFLPFLNLAGCVAITAIIGAQWIKERGMEQTISSLETKASEARSRYDAEKVRSAALENDVRQLKDSIESMMETRRQTEEAMAKLVAERDAWNADAANATSINAANQEQLKTWEAAVAERDTRIRELNESLSQSRARLNEAIAKLKEAGAR